MARHVFPRRFSAILAVAALAGAVLPGVVRAQDEQPVTAPVPAAADATPVVPEQPPGIGSPLPASLPVRRLGAAADTEPGLLLADVSGDPERPVVLVFWSLDCPVCRRYGDQLSALAGDWREKANVIVVVSGADQPAGEVRAALEGLGPLHATILLDPVGDAARSMGVRVTPTALVVDAANVIRYVGPLDDDRRARGRDARALLRPAVEAVLAGNAPETAEARAFGSAVR